MDRMAHWDSIYARQSPQKVSWYEPTPAVSLRLVREAIKSGVQSFVDVGGGASLLVDEVLRLGLRRIAVLDVSERAIDTAKARLGHDADKIEWIVGDLTALTSIGQFGVWHDRAVFHFLTDLDDQEAYVSLCERTVIPGGVAIVATLAPEGPEMCSGLPVQRYDELSLRERCGPKFKLMDSERYVHTTPRGIQQRFMYTSFRRASEDRWVAQNPAVPV